MFDSLGKLIAGPEIWASATYRKVMMMLYTLVFGYLGILWLLACVGGPGWITMTMWLFIGIFTVAYWQPRLGGLSMIVEWFNTKDDPAKKSVWRLYLLIFLASIVAGTLAIVLRQAGAGMHFPLNILALVTLVVICLLLPNQSRLDIWLPRIGAVVVVVALLGTIMGTMGGWSANLYERTGYSLNASPSKAAVAARKAMSENALLADQATEQCIVTWKQKHMSGSQVVREDQIMSAVQDCQLKFAPTLPPSSQKEMVGGKATIKKSPKASYFSYDYWRDKTLQWSEEWGWPIWIVAIIVIGTVLLHFIPILWGLIWGVKKLNDDTVVIAGKQTVTVKKKSFEIPWGFIFSAAIIYALISWLAGGWITSSADISRMFNQKTEQPQSTRTGLIQAGEGKDWVASMNSIYQPIVYMFTGPGGLPLEKYLDLGSNSYISNHGVEIRVLTFTGEAVEDIILEGSCAKKEYCTGVWHFADNRTGGKFALDVYPGHAVANLYYQSNYRAELGMTFTVIKRK